MPYTVKTVAELAGLSIRALHHYDEIGLLKAADVSASGYRLYSESDLERLQQILFFKELGFGLKEIREILDRPDFDRRQTLLTHRQLLMAQQDRLTALIESVDRTLSAIERGEPMDTSTMFEGFDSAQLEEWKREAKERWAEGYAESERRTSRYTKEDWQRIMGEAQAITEGLAALMDRAPTDPEVQQLVARWHRHIDTNFYSCSLEIFRGLGTMYVEDARFTATYDRVKPGLAVFKRDAMLAYCDAQEA